MSDRTSVRPATPADYVHFVRLFRELGVDDPIPEPARWSAEMAPSTRFLERDGAVVAYGFFEVLRGTGYVRHVAVDPACRREGLGRRMMQAIAEVLRGAGCDEWRLNVMANNAPAIALYRSLGLCIVFPTSVVRLPWAAIGTLPQSTRQVLPHSIDPRDDSRLERYFELPPGQLASFRVRTDQILVRLEDPRRPRDILGLARFDPAFPGAFPFRVIRPELARPLLEALEPHAPPAMPWIQLVVERDEALARTLLDVGAELKWEIVHMRGRI